MLLFFFPVKFCPFLSQIVFDLLCLFQEAASLCINHCILINRTDVLFGWIYQRYSESALKKAAFIECLEPHILSGELTQVTSDVMKDFVDHYEKKGSLGIVEACIINVDIANVDVRQVFCANLTSFTICRLWSVPNYYLLST